MTAAAVLVLAAGRGARFGTELPKQYTALGGKVLLRHSLEAFLRHPRIGPVHAVINPVDRAHYEAAAAGLDLPAAIAGGASRQDSARLGLEALAGTSPGIVLIHDGARPFVSAAAIDRVLDGLDGVAGVAGAISAVPVTDSLKRGAEGRIVGSQDRRGLWRAQTPQGFRFTEILAAHRAAAGAGAELTDDAAVAERAGLPLALVAGEVENFKVTTASDLARAARWLAGGQDEIRVGHGFDVHRFGNRSGPGTQVKLCGVAILHPASLLGHSDADVGLHAVTNAILGALGAGDIGSHFPPSETRWRGADSGIFLDHARVLAEDRGGRIVNVDVTLICEEPKIGPHRDAMVARIADLLGIETARVSVKATTTEGLGFTGRGEGIAAQATTTLRLPSQV